jgi:hypothetical protein
MTETRVWDVIETPRARHTDRQTSWDAANSVKAETISILKKRILYTLESPKTDEDLVFALLDTGTPSGIRSRRSELEKEGLVQVVGYSKTASGRKCCVFQVVR